MPKLKSAPATVDAYLATQPETSQRVLGQVRDAIRKAIPAAEETISYQIPCFKLSSRPVIYFAAWTKHYAVYPATEHVLAELSKDLAGFSVSKGTIRFPLSEPVPVALIERIATLRAAEVASLPAKTPARKTR